MESIYYSPKGYWRGKAAISKLAASAKVSRDVAAAWLARQAIWQIFLNPPKKIQYAHFDVTVPNEVHQADILFLPHDTIKAGRRQHTYRYALTVVDVASRYKEAQPLSTKTASEVASAFKQIYQRGPLQWPKLLQVDPGKEFLGAVSSLMNKHNVKIRQGHTEIHRDQAIVERFNRTLAERLFGYQYAKEISADFKTKDRSREWVARLPSVIAALNKEVTRATSMKPSDAITKKYIPIKRQSISQPVLGNVTVRYLYEPGELEGGRKRATDPIWSVTTHKISSVVRSTGRPAIYRLDSTAPRRGFVREQLQIIPEDTQLPPSTLL